MLLPPMQLATCPHPAAPRTVLPTTPADSRSKGCGGSCAPEGARQNGWLFAHVAKLAVATVRPAAVSVQPQQVLRGRGSRATRERCERRIRVGNRRGAERWWLRGQALPQAGAAPAPMLSEDEDGDGGAAPRKRPLQGHSEAPGQKRRHWPHPMRTVKRHVNPLVVPNHAAVRTRQGKEDKQGGMHTVHLRVQAGPAGGPPKVNRLRPPRATYPLR